MNIHVINLDNINRVFLHVLNQPAIHMAFRLYTVSGYCLCASVNVPICLMSRLQYACPETYSKGHIPVIVKRTVIGSKIGC